MNCYFKCPECGWGLLPACIYDAEGACPNPEDARFNYCFHCGYKFPEPDTLEKIERDAKKSLGNYWNCYITCDKCPSKINEQTPLKHFNVEYCNQAQKLDLLRRQREVLENKGD